LLESLDGQPAADVARSGTELRQGDDVVERILAKAILRPRPATVFVLIMQLLIVFEQKKYSLAMVRAKLSIE
jgi:hypothetical protein